MTSAAADLAADRIISEGLRAAFPEVPLVTEEQLEDTLGRLAAAAID